MPTFALIPFNAHWKLKKIQLMHHPIIPAEKAVQYLKEYLQSLIFLALEIIILKKQILEKVALWPNGQGIRLRIWGLQVRVLSRSNTFCFSKFLNWFMYKAPFYRNQFLTSASTQKESSWESFTIWKTEIRFLLCKLLFLCLIEVQWLTRFLLFCSQQLRKPHIDDDHHHTFFLTIHRRNEERRKCIFLHSITVQMQL